MVSQSPAAARGDHHAHTRFIQISDLVAVGITDDCADGNRKLDGGCRSAVARVPHAGVSRFAGAMRPAVIVQQGGDARFCDQHDVAAVSAVSAVRTAKGFELFSAH